MTEPRQRPGSPKQIEWAERIRSEEVVKLRAELAESRDALATATGVGSHDAPQGNRGTKREHHLMAQDGSSLGLLAAHLRRIALHPVMIGWLNGQTSARVLIDRHQEIYAGAWKSETGTAARKQYEAFAAEAWRPTREAHPGDLVGAARLFLAAWKTHRTELQAAAKAECESNTAFLAEVVDELPELVGSERQVAWADEIRNAAMVAGRVDLDILCRHVDAKWWIDNRKAVAR